MKNHEGYYDPTAGVAVRRTAREKKRRKPWGDHLTYLIGEVKGFPVILK